MSRNEQLTLIIVSFNSFDVIERCLDEVLNAPKFRIIVVDNASLDTSAAKLTEQFPDVEVLPLAQNVGYGRAANRGLAMVETPFALLLNPDVQATPDKLNRLLERLGQIDEDTALLGPAVQTKDHLQQGLVARKWIIGAAMAFNMRVMRPIGFFDEQIFLFSEETDLCLRIHKAQKKIYLDSDLLLPHLSKQSSAPSRAVDFMKGWHYGWSNQYLLEKHGTTRWKTSSLRRAMLYGMKSLLARDPQKKLEYTAKYAGVRAFMKGEAAFNADGSAQCSHLL